MTIYSTALWYGGSPAYKAITYNYNFYSLSESSVVANQIISLFQGITSVSDLNFAVSNFPGTWIDKNNGLSGFTTDRSYANYPNNGADIYLSVSHFSGSTFLDHSVGTFNFVDLLHEASHSVGLKHVHVNDSEYIETAALSNLRANLTYFCGDGTATYSAGNLNRAWMTVMSYDYDVNRYATKPMILDVITLGEQYGITNKNIGDTVYSASNGYVVGKYSSVVDTSGNDSIDMSSQSTNMVINLGVDVGALYSVGIVTTSTGWANMHKTGDVVTNPESLLWLYGNFENATGGSGNDTITGNSLNNSLIGGDGNDTIYGDDGDDSLSGGNGNDILYGNAGDDTFDWDSASRSGNETMYGGIGNDIYVLDSSLDTIVELINEGTDVVWTDFTFSLISATNVENLYLFGSAAINGTGNSLNNTVKGNTGNNLLDGGDGEDTAQFTGAKASYTIQYAANKFTVSGIDGIDILTNFEYFLFSDIRVSTASLISALTVPIFVAQNIPYRVSSANLTLAGSSTVDTVAFTGTLSKFTISAAGANSSVKDNSGTLGVTTLQGIERLSFSDINIALDIGKDQTAGSSYMLYKAAFNRTPDAGGLGYWISKMDSGMSYSDVAKNFVTSAEFKTAFGGSNPSVNTLVTKLYNNVLNRTPDSGGLAFWQDKLSTGGWTVANVLGYFATSAENVMNVTPLIANGIAYQEWAG